MTTDEMRKGFGTAMGRSRQVAAYHKALNEAADEIELLRRELKRECADTDKVFSAIGFDVGHIRTEGGSLRVASLKHALRHMVDQGSVG